MLKDRGSFLNLDQLLEEHLRLGVDAYYLYGLLPVLLQHWLFEIFGRGYGPMIASTLVVMVAMAAVWAAVAAIDNKREVQAVAVIVLLTPIVLWVNPNFPYSIVQLTILGSLLLVLKWRLDLALLVAVIGCWSVPSLPLCLTALLVILIVGDWWNRPGRSALKLTRRLTPAITVYLAIGTILVFQFGLASVLATALPIRGAAFYRTAQYGFTSLRGFISPGRLGMLHYVGSPAGWWLLSNAFLLAFGIASVVELLRSKRIIPAYFCIILSAILEAVFIAVAYGSAGQHVIYDPIVVFGVLLGLFALPLGRFRVPLTVVFVTLGVASTIVQARDTANAWRYTSKTPQTAGLYADRAWEAQWSQVLRSSRTHDTFVLSYGSGIHHYFPNVRSPDVWFMQVGQLLPQDEQRVLAQLYKSDSVVEDLTSATSFIDRDPSIQQFLKTLCISTTTKYFKIWKRCKPVANLSSHYADRS